MNTSLFYLLTLIFMSHASNSYAMEAIGPQEKVPLQWFDLPTEMQHRISKTTAKLAYSDLVFGKTHDDYAKAKKTLTTLHMLAKRNPLLGTLFFQNKPKEISNIQGYTGAFAQESLNFNELFVKATPDRLIIDRSRVDDYYFTLRNIVEELAPFSVDQWEEKLVKIKKNELFEKNIACPGLQSPKDQPWREFDGSIFKLFLDKPHAEEAVTFLISKGAFVSKSLVANIASRTSTHPSSSDDTSRHLKVIQLLADKVDPNALSYDSHEPALASLVFLYEKSKDPLVLATMEALIKAGADVNKPMSGNTPLLMYAQDNQLAEIVQLLTKHKATSISLQFRTQKKLEQGKRFIENQVRRYIASRNRHIRN